MTGALHQRTMRIVQRSWAHSHTGHTNSKKTKSIVKRTFFVGNEQFNSFKLGPILLAVVTKSQWILPKTAESPQQKAYHRLIPYSTSLKQHLSLLNNIIIAYSDWLNIGGIIQFYNAYFFLAALPFLCRFLRPSTVPSALNPFSTALEKGITFGARPIDKHLIGVATQFSRQSLTSFDFPSILAVSNFNNFELP